MKANTPITNYNAQSAYVLCPLPNLLEPKCFKSIIKQKKWAREESKVTDNTLGIDSTNRMRDATHTDAGNMTHIL